MKYLAWLPKAAIFLVLFAFALNNQDPVQVNLLFGAHWQAPMVIVLFIAVLIGVFIGMMAVLPLWLRARKASRVAAQTTAPNPTPAPTTPDDQTLHGI